VKWCSVIPLHNFAFDRDEPVEFGAGLKLCRIPPWLKNDPLAQRLGARDRDALEAATHGFVAEYDAASLGDPDPTWKGATPKSVQDTKYEMAVLANFALWLAGPSAVCFVLVFHAPRFGEQWTAQQCEKHTPLLCDLKDVGAVLTEDDVQQSRRLHIALAGLPRNNAVWTAVRSGWAALQMNMEEVRYLLWWIALEALFGPDDAREISYRLAQRVALFLAADRESARNMFLAAKKGYSARSQVVHGHWRANPESDELMATTEAMIRQSMTRILLDDHLEERFLGRDRETYLDELLFRV
jgi:hypothetical protein